jgi:hypothetical protein
MPRIGWSGSEFGVASIQPCDPLDCAVFTRATAAGAGTGSEVTLSSTGFTILDQGDVCGLAWTGSAFAVAYQGDTDRYVRFVTPTDLSLGSEQHLADVNVSGGTADCLAWSGSEVGTVWMDIGGAPWFQRFDGSGTAVGTAASPSATVHEVGQNTLAWTGSRWMIVWVQHLDPEGPGLVAVVLHPDGASAVPETPFVEGGLYGLPPVAVSWMGSELGVLYSTDPPRELAFGRVDWCR